MKHVHKEYEQAFLIEPTKLVRIVDTIHQRLAAQSGAAPHDSFEVFLTGSRREEMTSIDDVLALDNSKRQRIVRLLLVSSSLAPGSVRPEHEVQVDFAGPKPGGTSKVVTIDVRSDATGWTSSTLSEVEEQVERTWLPRGRPIVALALLFAAALVLLLSQVFEFTPPAQAQYMWLNDSDLERIQSLLSPNHTLTEQELREVVTMQLRNVAGMRQPPRPTQGGPPRRRILAVIVPLLVVLACTLVLLITCYPNAIFLWGDEIQRYQTIGQRRKVMWGIIIGVTVIGVSSQFIFEAWFSR